MTPIKKKIIFFLSVAVLILLVLAGIKFFLSEDGWICEKNAWVKHGNPSEPMPEIGCNIPEVRK